MKEITRGAAGELLAARFLRDKGYDILSSNFRCRFGEIDIIAADDTYLIFVEVKTRAPNALYSAREAVDVHKQKRILRAAKLFWQQTQIDLQPRFDVVEVMLPQDDLLHCLEIDHIQNAFDFDDNIGSF